MPGIFTSDKVTWQSLSTPGDRSRNCLASLNRCVRFCTDWQERTAYCPAGWRIPRATDGNAQQAGKATWRATVRYFETCMEKTDNAAEKLLGVTYESMDERTRKVARHVTDRKHIARNVAQEFETKTTPGQRAADAVATFGGSWTFIAIFAAILVVWVGSNSFILVQYDKSFDPYPYILLNLFLSMLAAIQAPIILMSQNRQAEKDRINAEHDYEVNLKAELEIMLLHDKLDLLRQDQWVQLLEIQREQLKLLGDLMKKTSAAR